MKRFSPPAQPSTATVDDLRAQIENLRQTIVAYAEPTGGRMTADLLFLFRQSGAVLAHLNMQAESPADRQAADLREAATRLDAAETELKKRRRRMGAVRQGARAYDPRLVEQAAWSVYAARRYLLTLTDPDWPTLTDDEQTARLETGLERELGYVIAARQDRDRKPPAIVYYDPDAA